MSKKNKTATIGVAQTNNIKGYTKIIAITDMVLTKKSRDKKNPIPLPEHLVGLKKYVMTVVTMGHSYEDLINNLLNKAGLNCVHPVPKDQDKLFEAEQTYSVPCANSTNKIMREHKEHPERKYVRGFLTPNVPPNFEVHYINAKGDEIFPTQEEKDNFFPLTRENESQKQADLWLEGNAQVRVRDWKAENVVYVQNGKTVWNNLDEKTMELFDLTYVEDGE